eukprot:gnl/Hemi2/3450_TR1198_c0_g1_i1.p2 gnl/Hemi2/3450_TR1198_c0_g1~~gnl/Hemi2/3450_TR1198_c0_g1_i1.p2  ORF type:complete len:425 (-),score=150.81 gnl/Hemi2/3450_TR1198_c0_g1_i1:164-1438(-)
MHKYRVLGKKGEGTFSEVVRAELLDGSKKHVAIKRMKHRYSSYEQVYNLREVQALRRLSPHPNIITMLEVIYDQPSGSLAIVCELMDLNIYELIKDRTEYLPERLVKLYMFQLLQSVHHMHKNGIFHRDIKPENILVRNDQLKLADFGSCKGVFSRPPYTEYISTRWYRAPECILTDGSYGYKMDMWGIGCVMFEVISLYPLFPGKNELDQIHRIHDIIGTPRPEVFRKIKRRAAMRIRFPHREGTGISRLIPHASAECKELIKKLLVYNPEERLSAGQALRHAYFNDVRAACPVEPEEPLVAGTVGRDACPPPPDPTSAETTTAVVLPPIKKPHQHALPTLPAQQSAAPHPPPQQLLKPSNSSTYYQPAHHHHHHHALFKHSHHTSKPSGLLANGVFMSAAKPAVSTYHRKRLQQLPAAEPVP